MLYQEDSNLNICLSHLYNVQLRICHIALAGWTFIQALFEELLDKNIFHCYKVNNKGYITYLFVANPRVLEIFCNYYDILLLDCIYNSNQFKIILLNILRVSEISITIQVAFVFMKAEKKADYL